MIESNYLKDNIENIQKLMALPTLRQFESKSLGKLLKLSRVREYEDGEVIIREGDADPWLYFLLAGKIRVTKDGTEIGTTERKGEIFGEMRLIDRKRRSATVTSAGRSVCLAVDTSAKRRLAAASPEEESLDFLLLLYRIFAEYMAVRLRTTNEELIAAKARIRQLTEGA